MIKQGFTALTRAPLRLSFAPLVMVRARGMVRERTS